jgi:hypothetical protein
VLDHSGKLLTQRKSDTAIQPRSLAVSSDGTRIVAADQLNLYGFDLLGLSAGDTGSDTIYVEAPLNPITTAITLPPATPVTSQSEVTMPAESRPTTLPAPTATQKSPAAPWIVIPAAAAALVLAGRK